MRDVRENYVSQKSLAQEPVCKRRRHPRILALSATALGLRVLALAFALNLALNFAPVALGQSQSGSSSTAQAPAQSSATAKPPATSQSEPQMQDQSAPPEESLAAAARKAKAQKNSAAPGKVYTEEKLAGLSGHGVSTVGSGNSGGEGSSGSGDAYADPGANAAPQAGKSDEKYWRGRAQAIRDQMAGMDRQIAAIQEEIKEKGAVTVDPMSGVQAGVIYIEDRNAQIKQIEGQKAKLQDQLDTLAEEGRKAGADSGWFR